jgi:dTMP kinase
MKYHVEFDIEFKRNPYKGLYIAIEGTDGSGKTTQINALYNYFKSQGREVLKTREPRKKDGIIAKLVQKILLGKVKVPSVSLQYLFSADRQMNHVENILPALKAGKVVISDRCFWSAVAYGILDRGLDTDVKDSAQMLVSQSILSMYHQYTIPDITFYLDVPVKTAVKRVKRGDGLKEIYEDKKKLEKTLEVYHWLLKQFPKEFYKIDATKPVGEVTTEILSVINK